jgi:hypothetical protein
VLPTENERATDIDTHLVVALILALVLLVLIGVVVQVVIFAIRIIRVYLVVVFPIVLL